MVNRIVPNSLLAITSGTVLVGFGALCISGLNSVHNSSSTPSFLSETPKSRTEVSLTHSLFSNRSDQWAQETQTEPLCLLRDEPESLQLHVWLPTALPITVSKLELPTGVRATLYRTEFVSVRKESGKYGGNDTVRSQGVGQYPDVLVPLKLGEEVAAGRGSQTLWIDLEADHSAKPGRGNVLVECKVGEVSITRSYQLEVLDSQFPQKANIGNLVVIWSDHSVQAKQLLVDHRLSPQSTHPGLPTMSRPIKCWGTAIWSNANISSSQMDPAPEPALIQSRRKGAPEGTLPVNYTADEINGKAELFPILTLWAKALAQEGVKNLVVMKPEAELLPEEGRAPTVDIFVPIANDLVKSADIIGRAKARGSEIWTYTATNQDPYSPKWLVDMPAAGCRCLPGVFSSQNGATGFVYWAVDKWSEDPTSDVAFRHPSGEVYNGDGILVYPGFKFGIKGTVPSARLKWIRDGIEDFEYLSRIPDSDRRRLVSTISSNPTQWSQDPRDWVKFHNALRREYVRLAGR